MARTTPVVFTGILTLIAALTMPLSAHADLRLHLEGAGLSPVDEVLRNNGAGFMIGGSIDYEVVDLLAVGGFYSFNTIVKTSGEENPYVFGHTIGLRLDLRFVRHRTAGWFGNDSGDAYGEAFIELDLAYHNLALHHRIGWGFGLGYRVIVAGPFGLGPFFRFNHLIPGFTDDSKRFGHNIYTIFGLEMFLSFNVSGEEEEEPVEPEEEEEEGDSDDEWSDFEAVTPEDSDSSPPQEFGPAEP